MVAGPDETPEVGTPDRAPSTESEPDQESSDTAELVENTTTGFSLGASDAPIPPRRSRRFPLIGAVAAAVIGAGIAVAVLLGRATDVATLVAADHAAKQKPSPVADRARQHPAKSASASVPATLPTPTGRTEPTAEVGSDRTIDSAPDGKPTEPTTTAPPPAQSATAMLPGAETIPEGVHAPTVLHRIYLAMQRAENCHKGGRAIGTTTVWFTFSPDGAAPEVRLDGEPIASAPVGNCVRAEARKVRVPKYQGDPFIVKHKLRLR
jgi:hypothetical protein